MPMYESILGALLAEWRTRIPPEDLIRRDLRVSIDEIFAAPKKVIAIVGLRRVGKTYIALQMAHRLISRGIEVIYANFEDERLPSDKRVLEDFLSLLKGMHGDLSKAYIILDELQRFPDWGRWLRRFFDMERPNIIITGSSSKLTSLKLPYELRGRSLTVRVFPLRFWEFVRFKDEKINVDIVEYSDTERSKLIRLFEEYLIYGGLPEVVLAPRTKKILILQDYFNAIVLKDIIEKRGDVRDVSKVVTLVKMLVNSTYFSASRLENTMRSIGYKMSRDSILEYKEDAQDAFLIDIIPQLTNSLRKQLLAPSKLYVADNGLITALSRLKIRYGRLLENLVFIELQRRYFGDPSVEIAYWVGRKSEVDFIVRSGFEVLDAIQVCWDPMDFEVLDRELRGLKNFMRINGIKKATIITAYHEERRKIGNKVVKFMPYWKWELAHEKSLHTI